MSVGGKQRKETVAAPPLHGVQSLGPSDQKAVEEDRQGLSLGTPQGAVG